jgi:POT family proton-dependent oligopeptide transporter
VIIFVIGFWSLFDQKDTTWVLQATKMDRTFTLPLFGSFTLLPAQTASANPILVLVLIPLFITVVFPALERMGLKITPIGRMAVGMLLVAFSFVLTAWLQIRIDNGETVHFAWQLVAYVILTTAEILVSATGLEFAYSQAPRRMKSTVMAFFYLTVSFANIFVAIVLDATKDKPLVGQFWFFAGVMAIIGVLFAIRVKFYKSREYAQE